MNIQRSCNRRGSFSLGGCTCDGFCYTKYALIVRKLTSLVPNSHLSRLLAVCAPLSQSGRARVIEEDVDLEAVYKSVAQKGDSEVPQSPEDVVDFHYVCFVKSHTNGRLYEVDGDKQEPVDMGTLDLVKTLYQRLGLV